MRATFCVLGICIVPITTRLTEDVVLLGKQLSLGTTLNPINVDRTVTTPQHVQMCHRSQGLLYARVVC